MFSIFIAAMAIPLGAFLGGLLAGAEGSGPGAVVGAAFGLMIASRFLLDSMAVAAARRKSQAALEADGRIDQMRRRQHRLRSAWSFSRLLRQDDKERWLPEKQPAVKRLYSQQHHDLDIRDIPGAAHLARKRKRKR